MKIRVCSFLSKLSQTCFHHNFIIIRMQLCKNEGFYNLYLSYESKLVSISEVNSAEISSVNLPRRIKCNTNIPESSQERRQILTSLPN